MWKLEVGVANEKNKAQNAENGSNFFIIYMEVDESAQKVVNRCNEMIDDSQGFTPSTMFI